MAVDNPAPNEGAAVTFTLTITNHGPDGAGSITVLDHLPVGLDYKSDFSSQGSYTRATGVWAVGNLASGGSATLALTAVVTDGFGGLTVVNDASITASDHRDLVASNNTVSTPVAVPIADLGVTLAVGDAAPNEGSARSEEHTSELQ